MTKEEASYRVGSYKKNCGNCVHYKSGYQKCTVVQGRILKGMLSDYWKAKGKKP